MLGEAHLEEGLELLMEVQATCDGTMVIDRAFGGYVWYKDFHFSLDKLRVSLVSILPNHCLPYCPPQFAKTCVFGKDVETVRWMRRSLNTTAAVPAARRHVQSFRAHHRLAAA